MVKSHSASFLTLHILEISASSARDGILDIHRRVEVPNLLPRSGSLELQRGRVAFVEMAFHATGEARKRGLGSSLERVPHRGAALVPAAQVTLVEDVVIRENDRPDVGEAQYS